MKSLFALFIMLIVANPAFAGRLFGDFNSPGEIVSLVSSRNIELTDIGHRTPNNEVQTGLKVKGTIFAGNGLNYEMIGVLSMMTSALTSGPAHDSVFQDVIGVQGTVVKGTTSDVVGLRCNVFDNVAGGTSTCLRVDFPLTNPGTATVGINLDPHAGAAGIVGIQLLNESAYKYGIDINNAPLAMGRKAGVVYCLKFNEDTAELDYIKNCGTDSEEVVGQVAMATSKPAAAKVKGWKPKR